MKEEIRAIMRDYLRRTVVSATFSSGFNLVLGVGKLILGIISLSPWFVVNAVYYLLLSACRIQAVRKLLGTANIKDRYEKYNAEFTVYKRSGVFLCLMGAVYFVVCLYMYFNGDRDTRNFNIILAIATIAFTKIVLSIIGLVKTKGLHNPILSVIKIASFTDAMVSIVVTQCALLSMEGSEHAVSSSALFGMGCGVMFAGIGVFMILRKKSGNKIDGLYEY